MPAFPRYSDAATPANALTEGQAGNATTANSLFYRAFCLINARVLDRDLNTPPGSPADGDCYLIAAAPTGAWATHALDLTLFITGTGWVFADPKDGMIIRVVDEKVTLTYSQTESLWSPLNGMQHWSTTEFWTGEYGSSGGKLYCKCFAIAGPLVQGLNLTAHGISPINLSRHSWVELSINVDVGGGVFWAFYPGVQIDLGGMSAFGAYLEPTNLVIDVVGAAGVGGTAKARVFYEKT